VLVGACAGEKKPVSALTNGYAIYKGPVMRKRTSGIGSGEQEEAIEHNMPGFICMNRR